MSGAGAIQSDGGWLACFCIRQVYHTLCGLACSRLARLKVTAAWDQVPNVLAMLPLTCLKLRRCKLGDSYSNSGMSRALKALAPTLKVGKHWLSRSTPV